MKGSFLIRSLVLVAVFMNPISYLTTNMCMDSESLPNYYGMTCLLGSYLIVSEELVFCSAQNKEMCQDNRPITFV